MSLDNFLEVLDSVPAEFSRSFALIKKLDKKTDDLAKQMEDHLAEYKKCKSLSKRKEIASKTDQMFEKIYGYSDDKVELALQTYEIIDRNIRKLIEFGQVKREPNKDEEAAGTSDQLQVTPLTFDMPRDPNEPRYCICNEVSHGEMVACDNKECPIEWFHLGCVNLIQAPEGKKKWYCASCLQAGFGKRPRNRKKGGRGW